MSLLKNKNMCLMIRLASQKNYPILMIGLECLGGNPDGRRKVFTGAVYCLA